MANKTFNVRISSKVETLANWESANPVLLAGETAYVVIPAEDGAAVQTPVTLTKVGDGTSKFKALAYAGAIAADVYDWAKAETKPEYQASEIKYLADYVAGEVQNTDTQYKVVKVDDYNYKLQSKELDGAWADVAGSEIVIPEFDASVLETDIATNATNIATNATNIATNTAAIETLNGTGDGSVSKAAADAVATIVADADENYDTLKKIADYIATDATGAADMSNSIATLTTLVGDTAVATQIAEAIDEALNGDGDTTSKYALASELTALADRVAALEAKEATWDAAEQNAKDYADGLAGNYDAAGAADTALTDAKTYADGLAGGYEASGAADQALEDAKAHTDALEETLSDVATSGDISDLAQAEDDYIVFNCGSATEVI